MRRSLNEPAVRLVAGQAEAFAREIREVLRDPAVYRCVEDLARAQEFEFLVQRLPIVDRRCAESARTDLRLADYNVAACFFNMLYFQVGNRFLLIILPIRGPFDRRAAVDSIRSPFEAIEQRG